MWALRYNVLKMFYESKVRSYKGYWKLLILYDIAKKPKKAYDVVKSLEALGIPHVSCSTVYYILDRMSEDGLVVAKGEDGKRIYEITDRGKRYLEEHKAELEEALKHVDALKKLYKLGLKQLISTIMDLLRATPYLTEDEERKIREYIADFVAKVSYITAKTMARMEKVE